MTFDGKMRGGREWKFGPFVNECFVRSVLILTTRACQVASFAEIHVRNNLLHWISKFQELTEKNEKWNLSTSAIERKFIEYFAQFANGQWNRESSLFSSLVSSLLYFYFYVERRWHFYLYWPTDMRRMCVCCVRTTTTSTKNCRFANVFCTLSNYVCVVGLLDF